MSTTASTSATGTSTIGMIDQKLEVTIIPVSDVDRSKEFYQRLGWRLDVTPPGVVQLTPPGSWASVQFGPTLNQAEPGSSKSYLVVSDILAARDALVAQPAPLDLLMLPGGRCSDRLLARRG